MCDITSYVFRLLIWCIFIPQISKHLHAKPVIPSPVTLLYTRSSIVELQLIAAEIASRPSICPAFVAKPDSFQKFFNKINSPSNLVNVEEKVNGAKKILFANQNFITTTSKAAVCLSIRHNKTYLLIITLCSVVPPPTLSI